MSQTVIKFNNLDAFLLQMTRVDLKKLSQGWIPMIFGKNDYLKILRDLNTTHGPITTNLYLLLCEKVTKETLFIKVTHAELAKELGTSREYVTKAMKVLLSYRPNLVVQVRKGLYGVNPEYFWKSSNTDRGIYLAVIKEFDYQTLFEALEAKKKSDTLYDVIKAAYKRQ